MITRDLRGAVRIAGKMVPVERSSRVLLPLVSVVQANGRSVLRIDGSVEAPQGAVTGQYLTDHGQFTVDPAQATDIRGGAGQSAWTPMLAPEQDGTRTLIKVADWFGGTGTKPATGYMALGGIVADKAQAFNFNAAKRVLVLSAQTNASGVATISFGTTFATPPNVRALPATTAVLSGATRSTISNVTTTQCTVTVQQQAVITGVISLLTGATANVIVVEA